MAGNERLILAMAIDEEVTFWISGYTDERLLPGRWVSSSSLTQGNQIEEVKEAMRVCFERLSANEIEKLDALSISTIGLVDLHEPEVTDVRRPGWPHKTPIQFAELVDEIGGPKQLLKHRIFVHNDATCAALGEYLVGQTDLYDTQHAQQAFVFVRIGSGVNAGFIIAGQPWRGSLHPEFGHLRPHRFVSDGTSYADRFEGCCPVHGDCFEGLICAEALRKRREFDGSAWTQDIEDQLVSHYVGQMCVVATLTLAPARIVLGGTAATETMCGNVRQSFDAMIYGRKGGYPIYREIDSKSFIQRSAVGQHANLLGALAWGHQGLLEGKGIRT